LNREAYPDAVVYPETAEQISKLLQLCNTNRIPVIPFGAGSGFEGGVNAVRVKKIKN
jgi:FAD/FMN-containing dehydrogenase